VLIDRVSGTRKLFFGAMSTGTVTIAEFMPYLHAMIWYDGDNGPGKVRRKQASIENRHLNVHVITDSEVTSRNGNNPQSRKKHLPLWAAIDAFKARGYLFYYHHLPRDVADLNILTDEVSRSSRICLKEVETHANAALRKRYPGLPENFGPYDFCR